MGVEQRGSKQFLEIDLGSETAWGPHATTNNAFAAGESSFGSQNGSPNWLALPVVDDGFTVQSTPQRAQENLKANIEVQRPGAFVGFDTSGAINILAAPNDRGTGFDRSLLSWLLGSAINRSSGAMRSYSGRWHTPTVSTESFEGLMCNSLTIEGSQDNGSISFNSEWIAAGWTPADDVVATPKFPNKQGVDDTRTGEDVVGWAFARAVLMRQVSGGAWEPVATARSFTINVNNNLEPQAQKVKTFINADGDAEDTFVLTKVRIGEQTVGGSFVIDYTTNEFNTALREDQTLALAVIGRHPQSAVFQCSDILNDTTSLSVAAGWKLTDSAMTLEFDPTKGALKAGGASDTGAWGLFAGGAIMVENTNQTFPDYARDVVLIAQAYDGPGNQDITTKRTTNYWTPLGIVMDGGVPDFSKYLVYDQVFGIKVTGVKLDSAVKEGGPADIIGQNVQWTAGQVSGATTPIQWVTGCAGNPVA